MIEVLLPSLAEGMEEGTIARWLQADGAHVKAGDEIVEIEPDKVTMSSVAEANGVLRIVAPEGATVSVGAVIARIGASQEADVASPASAADQPQQPGEASREVAEPEDLSTDLPLPLLEGNVRATPVARLIARKRGLDLNTITGSGPRGLITRADLIPEPDDSIAPCLDAVAENRGTHGASSFNRPEAGETCVQELSRLQQVIAQRMTEAKATVPEFQVQTEATMDAVIEIRDEPRQSGALRSLRLSTSLKRRSWGVGAIRETLALHEGSVLSRHVLTPTLTCDHRILYGADAARLLSTVRELLEQPLLLLVGASGDSLP